MTKKTAPKKTAPKLLYVLFDDDFDSYVYKKLSDLTDDGVSGGEAIYVYELKEQGKVKTGIEFVSDKKAKK